jgi:nucleoside-diphosphate-sugar epimerase
MLMPSTSIATVDDLEEALSRPSESAVAALGRLEGDLLVLGVNGKMGPTLARMAARASAAAGVQRRVIGVSRFTTGDLESRLRTHGIETIRCDLLDPDQLSGLPDAANVIVMAGMKFGSTGQEALTWAINCHVPSLICTRFRRARIVAFSTGNVYGMTPIARGGSLECDPLVPQGEYSQSCLGRERIYEHFSRTWNIPMALLRLNYATELRYGVLVDVAQKVLAGATVDLTMGACNSIWQADANAMALCAFEHVASPPFVVNIAGPEMLSIRRVAEEFGRLFGKEVRMSGSESPDAFLSNGQKGHRLFGYPRVAPQQMMHWIADWLQRGGPTFGKPTHFEVRDGKF